MMLGSRSRWLRAGAATGALALALSGAVLGLGATTAGAVRNGPPGVGAGAMLQAGNDSCGQNLSFLPSIGVVGIARVGTEVTVTVDFQHALPYHDYYMSLWVASGRGGECFEWTGLGSVYTNTRGNGFGIFAVWVAPEFTWMFVAGGYGQLAPSNNNAPECSCYDPYYAETPAQYLPHSGTSVG